MLNDPPTIRYAQSWEDPDPLRAALRVGPSDDVVSIASGGDNSLALLLDGPRTLTVVDRNPAQLHLVELKIAGISLLDHAEFLRFLGVRPGGDRDRTYGHLRCHLSSGAREFWDDRPGLIGEGIIHTGKFERYFQYFRTFVLPLVHTTQDIESLLHCDAGAPQQAFYEQVWNSLRWRGLFRVFFGKYLLGHLGRDPSFFRYVTTRNVAGEILRRTEHGLTEVPTADNYFLEYILTGRYASPERAHPYMAEGNFHALGRLVSGVRLVHARLEDYLTAAGPGTVSCFNVSDIFEYMSAGETVHALQAVVKAARPGSRLALISLFVPQIIPGALEQVLRRECDLSVRLSRSSRTFFYGGIDVWTSTASGS